VVQKECGTKQKMQINPTLSMASIEIQQIAFLTTAAYVKVDSSKHPSVINMVLLQFE